MEERRRNKRLELNVNLELERLSENGVTTLKYIEVGVLDISKSGIGFQSELELEIGSFYNTRLQIWTKEVIESVLKIVRCEKKGDHYEYGGLFVGMTDTDSLKIEIYQMFNEAQQ